jgi:hypothetical protein
MRVLLITIASFAASLFTLCEVVLAFPVAWWLYLIVALMFTAVVVRGASPCHQFRPLFTLAGLWALIATLYFVEWTSRKPFLRDLDRVRVGMTEVEVRQIMYRYLEGTGWPAFPDGNSNNASGMLMVGSGARYPTGASKSGELVIRDSLVFRHSKTARFNSDWGIVSLSSGRVVSVSFSPD